MQETVHDALDGREKVGHLLEPSADGSGRAGLADEAVYRLEGGVELAPLPLQKGAPRGDDSSS